MFCYSSFVIQSVSLGNQSLVLTYPHRLVGLVSLPWLFSFYLRGLTVLGSQGTRTRPWHNKKAQSGGRHSSTLVAKKNLLALCTGYILFLLPVYQLHSSYTNLWSCFEKCISGWLSEWVKQYTDAWKHWTDRLYALESLLPFSLSMFLSFSVLHSMSVLSYFYWPNLCLKLK